MAKKPDKAVSDLAKEIRKLRKGNEKLVKTLEKAREDQAEAHREILALLEGRPTTGDAGPTEPVEGDHTLPEESPRGSEVTGGEVRPQDLDTIEPQEDHTPDVESEEEPEATEASERRAKELGVNLSDVKGTGSGGRILVKDVETSASGER